jgi:hypothetical protein
MGPNRWGFWYLLKEYPSRLADCIRIKARIAMKDVSLNKHDEVLLLASPPASTTTGLSYGIIRHTSIMPGMTDTIE